MRREDSAADPCSCASCSSYSTAGSEALGAGGGAAVPGTMRGGPDAAGAADGAGTAVGAGAADAAGAAEGVGAVDGTARRAAARSKMRAVLGFSLRRELLYLGAAAAAFVLGLLTGARGPLYLAEFPLLSRLLFVAAYILAGRDVLVGAARNIVRGRVFDELFLMSIATLGAMAIGRYEEAVEVMVFYKVGEALQGIASQRSRASVRALLALRPSTVRLRRGGLWVQVDPDQARAGEEFMVMPGERAALDGRITEGACFVDSSALTGESLPKLVAPGAELLAGVVALDGSLIAVALRSANQSAAARIASLVEAASKSKARVTRLVTRFAAVYTPIVVAAAAALAFLPPLLIPGQSLATWAYRALVLLVISCPCALVVSVPLGYFCGMGAMARRGILVKGAEVLDALAKARTVVFDKTGTLTAGEFKLRVISPEPGFAENEILGLAAAAESRSRHPIAASIRAEAASRGLSVGTEDEASAISERPGAGVVAYVGGRRVAAGSDRLLHLESIPHEGCDTDGTTVNIAVDGVLAGRILVGDEVKADAGAAVNALNALGVSRTVMLTGDSHASALPVATKLGIAELGAALLPQGKLDYLDRLITETTASGGSTVFVGDGINDAPALARADVGAAMGAGSDAAVEQADLVLMNGEPSRLGEAIERSRRTKRIVVQGIVLALAVKAVFFGLGAFGLAEMWQAVIADVGVALIAIANALRAMR
jgi:Zn2+/Cd2+-exporting ATPase